MKEEGINRVIGGGGITEGEPSDEPTVDLRPAGEPLADDEPIATDGAYELDEKRPPKKGKGKKGQPPLPPSGVKRVEEIPELAAVRAGTKPPAAEDLEQRRTVLEHKLDALEISRQEYARAKQEMVVKIRELRQRIRRRQLTDEDREQAVGSFVGRFAASENGRVLKQALKDIDGGRTFKEKLGRVVDMALDLEYWSQSNLNFRYRKKYGAEISDDFDDTERMILDDLEQTVQQEEEAAPQP